MNKTASNHSTCPTTSIPFEESRQFLVVVYSLVFTLGLPTNFLTAFITCIQISKKNITAIYLCGLSLCELMYLSTLPIWIVYVQNQHVWKMGRISCQVVTYIFFCNIYISILLLCCISIDRYVAVAYALESRGKWCRCQRTATVVTVVLFGTVAVIYSPVFFLEKVQEQHCTTCFEMPVNKTVATSNIIRFFVGFLIPFGLLICMNYKVFQNIKASSSLSPRHKAKVKNLALAIIIIFLVCFAPYHCVLLVRSIHFFWCHGNSSTFEEKIYTTSVVFLGLSTANAVADPFIYVLVSENARRDFHRTFRACGIHFSGGSNMESSKDNDSLLLSKLTKETCVLPNKEEREHLPQLQQLVTSKAV
ncbi:probable G-protein coupled receptor 132 isoform X2 [Varanus komodoensis]|nr:probable G-protein coupled receptor 132 isoform X2 [Varanus komodoensis]XP_044293129.1 probable G-protein coupled receptor 132 isoform X2 [Varanus komodoensis]XP_044293130.1 probable G-protein coupled receptor 132 isoform X2 [Varanus komodoensis]